MQKKQKPDVYVKKCKEYHPAIIEHIISEAFKSLGIIIKPKDKVLIKPNAILGGDSSKAIYTNPFIIEGLCIYLKKKKAKIIIAESSGNPNYKSVFSDAGLQYMSEKYKTELYAFEATKIKTYQQKSGKRLKEIRASYLMEEADVIINVPKLKTHTLMKYTGAIKNMFGVIPGGSKPHLHGLFPKTEDFAEALVDIYDCFKPTVTIMDAIVGMEGNGPTSGKPVHIEHLIIGKNGFIVDTIGEKLLGYDKEEIITNQIGKARGFLPKSFKIDGDYQSIIQIPKLDIEHPKQHKNSFLIRLFFSTFKERPKVIKDLCKRCGLCKKQCPKQAIRFRPYPKINFRKCIFCYCCHELCPYHAFTLKKSKFAQVLESLKNKLE